MTERRATAPQDLAKHLISGPIAILRDEDGVDLTPTIAHKRSLGFGNILVLGRTPPALDQDAIFMPADPSVGTTDLVNSLMDVLADRWVYWGHNAEYLYFPFCEGRSISDAAQFIEEERRAAVFCTTVDLYQPDLAGASDSWSKDAAHFDADGYFSKDRYDGPVKLDRQINVFGGLKWRYAEHIEWSRQRIDRIAFFKARQGLRLNADGLCNDPEMNTIACPWHHNMTFCIASYRVAKSLINNPGSTYEIETFMWDRSVKFDWTAQQLLELGLMEPGQWF